MIRQHVDPASALFYHSVGRIESNRILLRASIVTPCSNSKQIHRPPSNDRARGDSSTVSIPVWERHKDMHLFGNAWHQRESLVAPRSLCGRLLTRKQSIDDLGSQVITPIGLTMVFRWRSFWQMLKFSRFFGRNQEKSPTFKSSCQKSLTGMVFLWRWASAWT
jgi:hypothetical protein